MSARRQYSDKHALPANPTWIEFERSDGDENTWPSNTTCVVDHEGHVNFMLPLEASESVCVKWRIEVGAAVAAALRLPGTLREWLDERSKSLSVLVLDGPSYVLKNWPEGYRMFDHHKGPQATPRHDVYLMGERHCTFDISALVLANHKVHRLQVSLSFYTRIHTTRHVAYRGFNNGPNKLQMQILLQETSTRYYVFNGAPSQIWWLPIPLTSYSYIHQA
jgi:hypothetical protein